MADELIAQAKQRIRPQNQNDANTFLQAVGEDIAHTVMWRAVEAFGDTKIPRKELLARFAWIAKHFTQSSHASRAKETVVLLEKMVAEDEEHARRPEE